MFKVGDRVRVVGHKGLHKSYDHYGTTGIVTRIHDNGNLDMKTDNDFRRCGPPEDFSVISTEPPQKIIQNGYEYSLVGPVKPDWLVDGAWVIDKETGRKYLVSCDNGVYTFNNGKKEIIVDFISLPTRFRLHTASDWKWGDWAMYDGKKVFVMSSLTHDGLVGFSFPNIDGTDLTDPSDQWDFAEESELTPTF